MAERFSSSHEGGYKHLVEQDRAQMKLHSEADFWADMASGILPEAGRAIKTGEAWNAAGFGLFLGIGLNWALDSTRPAQTRLVGKAISSIVGLTGTIYTLQAAGELNHLKNKAIASGDYSSSLYDAQKLSGKFVAEGLLGSVGGLAGHLVTPGINRLAGGLGAKFRIAQTVPVGADRSHGVFGNTHSVEESPHYMAMSKGRKNRNKQKAFEQKPVEARPVGNAESVKQGAAAKARETADPLEAAKAEPEKKADTFTMLNEQAVRKGKPADPESFEDWSHVKKQQGKEAFDSSKKDVADLVGEMTYENRPMKQYRKLSTELAELKSSKNDEQLAELLLNDMENAASPHVAEARADRVLNANETFAGEVRDIARKSPFVRELFLESRSGKYPDDAVVLFTDGKGRLIQYSNEYVAYKALHYPLKHVAKGVAEFELIGSDVIKGATIFGSPEGGSRPLLGTVGDVPVRLSLCGNAKEFVMSSRLNKPLSHFIYKGIERELGKPALAEGDKCADGVCPLPEEFTAKLKASKTGALSKPEAMQSETLNVIESVGVFDGKPETVPLTKPQEMPVVEPHVPKSVESIVEPTVKPVVEPVVEPVIEPIASTSSLSAEQQIKLADLDKKARQIHDELLTNEQLSKKQRKIFDQRLKQIEREKASLLGEPKPTQTPIAKKEPVLDDQALAQEKIRQEEARQVELQKALEHQAAEKAAAEKTGEESPATAVKSEPQEKIAPEDRFERAEKSREKKFYTQADHDKMEVDLRIENEHLANAFASLKIARKGEPGEKVVFFVREGNLIKRVNFEDRHGNEKPMMSTKLDFHFGKVPVEDLKGEVIGWAQIAPKIDKVTGEYAKRPNGRYGDKSQDGRYGNNQQIETVVTEVHGEVPGSLRRTVEQNGEAPYGDLMRIPGSVPGRAKPGTSERGSESPLTILQRERDSVKNQIDAEELQPDQLAALQERLQKIDQTIKRHEGRVESVSKDSETTTHQQESIQDNNALNPKSQRDMRLEVAEKLSSSVVQQLDSWKAQPNRPKVKPVNGDYTAAEKLNALQHVAYNAHSRARELYSQGKMAEAEAWAMTLDKVVSEGSVEVPGEIPRFDILDKVRAASLLGEIFRVQNKTNEAESCFKWANSLLSERQVPKNSDRALLEASVLESYAKLLRLEADQARIQKAREFEADRRNVLEGLKQAGQSTNSDVGAWKKAPPAVRDRQTAQIDMVKNAKELENSLQILNWFNITL